MAKKKSSSSSIGWAKIAGFCAFGALILTAVCWILDLIVGSTGNLGLISNLLLVASVFISGWFFVCSTPLPGKKLYWQIALIAIALIAAFSTYSLGA